LSELKVNNLSVGFRSENGVIPILDNVSFEVRKGEIYGLVGESGCGKSVTALSVLRLLPQPGGVLLGGQIYFEGKNIIDLSEESMQKIRGNKISMIFQEPSSALNPLYTVKKQVMECFAYHEFKGNKENHVRELFKKVGLNDTERIFKAYPHELSGGMLQRVMIAIALVMNPSLIIADEPTTALDVTIQAQIMELLVQLAKDFEVSVLLITHNLGLIAQYADRLGVMYAGRIIEESTVDEFLAGARHPYTLGLVKAIPDMSATSYQLQPIEGQVPQPKDFVEGCRFFDRCQYRTEQCNSKPELKAVSQNRLAACFNLDKVVS